RSPVCACSLVSSLLLSGATMSQQSSLTQSAHSVRQVLTDYTLHKENRAEALRQSLPRLSPEHREVIDLAYYHGKSVKEIAAIVSISEATVKTRMFYARRKLAELVETT